MKKFLVILFSLLIIIIPNVLKANEKDGIESFNLEEALKREEITPLFEKYEENDTQAIIYAFVEKGESKSVALFNYLNSIYNDYGTFFKVRAYDVSNEKNMELLNYVKEYLHAESNSVPFIVIGDVHFVTYNENVDENIVKGIIMSFENENNVDIIDEVLVKYYRNYNLIIGVIIASVLVLIGFIVYASVKGKREQ